MQKEVAREDRDNLFLDPFSTVILQYGDTQALSYLEDKLVVSIQNSDESTGFYKNSDIIIQYDEVTRMPMVVAERVYRRRYPLFTYYKWKHQWRDKIRASIYTRVEGSPEPWKMRLSDCHTYFDIIFFNEEWFECQKELQIRRQLQQLS